MARKPGFSRSSKAANRQTPNSDIQFSQYQNYYDYGATRETDGDRFAVSDIKKAMNCYYDALICYQNGIKVFQENSAMLEGDFDNYQKIWYNYLRLLFFLLSEYKYVSGSVDILKYLPENTIKKELKDLVFEKENIMFDLYKSYTSCKNIIPLSEDSWDFYFNFLEFLNTFIEVYNTDKPDYQLLMNVLSDQEMIFKPLISLEMDLIMKYSNKEYLSNNNSLDPVVQSNMNLQKDIRFQIKDEKDTFAETMSNLTLNTFLEMYLIVFTSIRNTLEVVYSNIVQPPGESNVAVIERINSLHRSYFAYYNEFINWINNYDLKEDLNAELLMEVEYGIQLSGYLLNISDSSFIQEVVSNKLSMVDEISGINETFSKEKALLEIDQWDTLLELILPFESSFEYISSQGAISTNKSSFTLAYSWDTKWQLCMLLNKLTGLVNKEIANQIKTTVQKTKSFSSTCCNLVEVLQNKSDLEVKRAYLKAIPDSQNNVNHSEYTILLKNSLAYLKNALSYLQLDTGLGEPINDKLYRHYLLSETQEKIKKVESLSI